MNLTCTQMDVLISFYIEGDLSASLKMQVEEHLKSCASCRAKFDIIKSMLSDLKKSVNVDSRKNKNSDFMIKNDSQQYNLFKKELSAYIDNELSSDENIKIKKFTINNPQARKDLQDNYNIRKLMNDSFNKTKFESKQDFSKNILKKLEIDHNENFEIHPAIKILILFTFLVLTLTSAVLISLSV